MSKIKKAIAGALAAAGTALVAATEILGPGEANVTGEEALGILAAALVGFAVVYLTPKNTP